MPAAIIILGAAVRQDGTASPALRARVQAARAWGERQMPPAIYIPTGAIGRHPPAESVAMAAILMQAGVPEARIHQEPTGTDTFSSVLACVALLRRIGHRGEVRVATHRYHLPRSLLLFRLAGVPAHAVPPPAGPSETGAQRRWFWRMREVAALPYDAALMLWARLRRRI
ncbi:YdcF family protein [Falsiroseomonas sp.]|uniref:YdcF family protein n=1 Tax=Falsiroseomonas sp. TaxID=2870721 RepID=UPI0027163CAA|nr:YdcF family protein [Falsiroseomonas sp.]MDO9501287.1 YdcF family protein [Falsiroseomonas sp.]MDP3415623.1 YdcF family protein [Falsiroseomonas sp.]